MNIYLAPLKFSNTRLLGSLVKELSKKLSQGIINIDLNIDTSGTFSESRSQYYSTQIIAEAMNHTRKFNGKVVLLTELDLYVPVLTFVFGEAQLNGKHSLVSVCRLHEEFYSGMTDDDLLLSRTVKEVLHELGHNFGLKHCDDWDCVMHSSTSIEEVDIKGEGYCKVCARSIDGYRN
jgi:archaemetzincin